MGPEDVELFFELGEVFVAVARARGEDGGNGGFVELHGFVRLHAREGEAEK